MFHAKNNTKPHYIRNIIKALSIYKTDLLVLISIAVDEIRYSTEGQLDILMFTELKSNNPLKVTKLLTYSYLNSRKLLLHHLLKKRLLFDFHN